MSLLARLADAKDGAAWSEFIAIYEPAVYRYIRSRGLQDSDARDVVQNVLVAVHAKATVWEPEGRKGSFRCWLMRTSHRITMNLLRSARRPDRRAISIGNETADFANPIDIDSRDDEGEPGEWERWAFSWAAAIVKGEVAEVTWSAFQQTAVDGRSANDVALALGIRAGSVYTARCRVMARIKDLVSQLSRAEP